MDFLDSRRFNRIFPYFGAKWRLAKEIIALFPKHETYVEPFFGSGAIFFQKPAVANSILNDLDGNICNFFRVLREKPEELKALMDLTPFSRELVEGLYETGFSTGDSVKWAWEFFCWMHMSRGNTAKMTKGNAHLRKSYIDSKFVDSFCKLPEMFVEYASKLKPATIENRCVLKMLEDMEKLTEEELQKVFIFADPPYNMETRTLSRNKYGIDIEDGSQNGFEDKFLEKTSKLKAKIMVCGYDCPKYNEAYKGWNKRSWVTMSDMQREKTEIVWFNYDKFDFGESAWKFV
jgi:DNA adenine methylase